MTVHPDGAGGADLHPCIPGQLDGGFYADAEDHQISLDLLVAELHRPDVPVPDEPLDLLAGKDVYAVPFELRLHLLGDLWTIGEGYTVRALDQGDLHPYPAQVFGHLEPDVAAPHDDGLPR